MCINLDKTEHRKRFICPICKQNQQLKLLCIFEVHILASFDSIVWVGMCMCVCVRLYAHLAMVVQCKSIL